jgi:hypothetical protein
MTEPGRDSRPAEAAGLCAACAHSRVVASARGSGFVLCGLSRTDERFAKYPRLPVLVCRGFLPRDDGRETQGHQR